MLERMKLYNAFIKRARDNDWNADLLMVDTDIVFVGDVSDGCFGAEKFRLRA